MGKHRRMSHIFRENGKSLIVAIDHGTNGGALPGIEQPAEALKAIAAAGADAVIVNPGFAKSFEKELSGMGLIMRLDLPPTAVGDGHDSIRAYDVSYAQYLDADAVIINGAPGIGVEQRSLPAVAKAVQECQPIAMPVLGEMVPGGFDADLNYKTLDNLVLGARIASELGVDFIKIAYMPGFEKVVEGCFCPVVVLGGSKSKDPRVFLESIKEAIDAGASGVAVGRNVWGAENIYGMTRALCAVIHHGASVDQACDLLSSRFDI